MPGVDKGNVEVSVEDGILRVGGRLDFSKYEGLQPLYTEYNVGHYARSFTLSNKIDQNKIGSRDEGWCSFLETAEGGGSQAKNHSD